MWTGSEWLWCVGWATVIFALGHILAAVGGVKRKPTVHLLMVIAAVFVGAAIKFLLWGPLPLLGG